MIDSLIFDLDGTLWDTTPTCALAWNNVLKKNGIHFREISAEDVKKVTGLPHHKCIEETFSHLSKDKQDLISVETMHEDNKLIRDLGGDLYPQVPETLFNLSQYYPLFIVSNCQEGYIETFLDFTDFGNLFSDFECWGNTRRSKGSNILSLIERNSLSNPVYIGDTQGDLDAANESSLPFIYAEYGFGKINKKCPSFQNFADLETLVSQINRTDQFKTPESNLSTKSF